MIIVTRDNLELEKVRNVHDKSKDGGDGDDQLDVILPVVELFQRDLVHVFEDPEPGYGHAHDYQT